MNFLDSLKRETNYTHTENGASALKSTLNYCLDAFGSLGAMRNSSEEDIIETFSKAFFADRELAMKMLFYMRDIRGGQGARRVFRVIARWLVDTNPEYILNNLNNFLEYGRGDDILCLLDTEIERNVCMWAYCQIKADLMSMHKNEPCSLLAKWLPSENASSAQTKSYARVIIHHWGASSVDYRRILSKLRAYIDVVERKMSANDWKSINYEAVPSKASLKYTNAFFTHDQKGYVNYLKAVANKDAKVNAGALFPVDIVHKVFENRNISQKDRILYDAMWNALPNYCADKDETGICVVDTSGSMSGQPIEVAISLGMYCADKCRGPFKNHFITFSRNPQLQEVRGTDIVEKVRNLEKANWDMNTNLEAVFDLILTTAKRHNLSQEDMPKKLYIISDMQFDAARNCSNDCFGYRIGYRTKPATFMESMSRKYKAAGYEMPVIVYWNVRASKCGMFQQTFEGRQCCMVSGYSPSLFKSIIEGTTYEEYETKDENGKTVKAIREKVDPIDVMLATLNSERYAKVWVG